MQRIKDQSRWTRLSQAVVEASTEYSIRDYMYETIFINETVLTCRITLFNTVPSKFLKQSYWNVTLESSKRNFHPKVSRNLFCKNYNLLQEIEPKK